MLYIYITCYTCNDVLFEFLLEMKVRFGVGGDVMVLSLLEPSLITLMTFDYVGEGEDNICAKCISCYIYKIVTYGITSSFNWLREVKI